MILTKDGRLMYGSKLAEQCLDMSEGEAKKLADYVTLVQNETEALIDWEENGMSSVLEKKIEKDNLFVGIKILWLPYRNFMGAGDML